MFSCQYASDFYSTGPSENHCFPNQYQPSSNHQIHPRLDLPAFYHNSDNKFAGSLLYEENFNQFQSSPPFQHQIVQNLPPMIETPVLETKAPNSAFHHSIPYSKINCATRRPHAKISFRPKEEGAFKVIVKRKQKRTIFTIEQAQALEEIFKQKKYVTRENRKAIADQLQLNDKAVKIWFQNRRSKNRKIQEATIEQKGDEKYFNDANIDHVEISEGSDQYGNVRLNNTMVNSFSEDFDVVLSQNTTNFVDQNSAELDSSPLYEAISPASSLNNSIDENISYIRASPEESLWTLFDLQAMLLL